MVLLVLVELLEQVVLMETQVRQELLGQVELEVLMEHLELMVLTVQQVLVERKVYKETQAQRVVLGQAELMV
jgi:hypothetical protein